MGCFSVWVLSVTKLTTFSRYTVCQGVLSRGFLPRHWIHFCSPSLINAFLARTKHWETVSPPHVHSGSVSQRSQERPDNVARKQKRNKTVLPVKYLGITLTIFISSICLALAFLWLLWARSSKKWTQSDRCISSDVSLHTDRSVQEKVSWHYTENMCSNYSVCNIIMLQVFLTERFLTLQRHIVNQAWCYWHFHEPTLNVFLGQFHNWGVKQTELSTIRNV